MFWSNVGRKVVEICVSVKVLTIVAVLVTSTIMVYDKFLSGGEWAAVNGGVISTVYALREIFKIQKVKSKDDTTNLTP